MRRAAPRRRRPQAARRDPVERRPGCRPSPRRRVRRPRARGAGGARSGRSRKSGSARSAAFTPSRKTQLCRDVFADPHTARSARTRSRKERREVVGLLRAHRPADGERDAIDAEALLEQALVADDVVVNRRLSGKSAPRCGPAWLGEDEMPLPNRFGTTTNHREGSSARPGPMRRALSGVRPRVIRREEHGVVAAGVRRPVGRVDQPRAAEHLAGLQHDVAELERLQGGRRRGHPRSRAAFAGAGQRVRDVPGVEPHSEGKRGRVPSLRWRNPPRVRYPWRSIAWPHARRLRTRPAGPGTRGEHPSRQVPHRRRPRRRRHGGRLPRRRTGTRPSSPSRCSTRSSV